jgi:hypothetical protein
MGLKVGKFAKITIDDAIVAEMGSYTLSGFNRDTLEHTSFGDGTKKFVAGHIDGGDISFSGFYDATDTAGQRVLEACCEQGTILIPGRLKVYVDALYYFTVGASGTMFVTKAKGVGMDKAGIGTTDFTVKVAGDHLVLYPAVSLSKSQSPSVSPSASPTKSFSLSPSKSPSLSPSLSPSNP